jgi:hemolysin activation/secretion protein
MKTGETGQTGRQVTTGRAPVRDLRARARPRPGWPVRLVVSALLAVSSGDLQARPRFARPRIYVAQAPRAGKPAVPKILIRRIRVDGVSVIPAAEVAAIVAPFEGRELPLSELKEVAAIIERSYRTRGYFLANVFLPVQKVQEGDVRFLVIEGRAGEVKIEGNTYFSDGFIQRHFEPALAAGVIRDRPLRRAMLVLNEFPDLRVQSVIQKGKQAGTVDVILKATDERPLHLTLDYNNFGNRFVGRNRGGAGLTIGNAFKEGDSFNGRVVIPFPSESDPFLQFEYTLPIDDEGRRLGIQYASAGTIAGQELQVLDIRGDADILGVNVLFPLRRSTESRASLSVGFTSKSVDNFILGALPLSNDELRLLAASYSRTHVQGRHRSLAFLTLTQGLGSTFGGTPAGAPLASRVGASNDFTRLNVEVAGIQQMSRRLFAMARVVGQLTGTPLLVSEQFSLGGPDSVRGFLQSHALGDDGYAINLEMRFSVIAGSRNVVQAIAFYDHGGVHVELPQAGEVGSRSLTGAGLGLRASLFGGSTSLRADVGFPLAPDVDSNGDESTLHASASTRF